MTELTDLELCQDALRQSARDVKFWMERFHSLDALLKQAQKDRMFWKIRYNECESRRMTDARPAG